ncbi:glycosyltransferase family 4 protein [Budviciaceae bacterium BWR-B9]|uniref:Glycosyltransferase family 4 protein n=1 Tax=Limnobaculum allomyrinae TaxID=2791986 RepID=A0ABS1ITG9_9GAMM|nr:MULTISPECIES: glycosyltransferase family 4 protein [Limnobaculum]MBK5145050.1 glycosyltransferase family 4 protein [Limnobaculum allomyrinae]MBV7692881.1 glycosyltransferase family 4 protein [Limnobaculum sp. M2-1]
MKLALIIDDYLPHSTRVGAKMFHELALELYSRGHKITVITPSYQQDNELYIEKIDGITVWRFKNGQIKNVGKIRRAINETLLSFKAWRAINSSVMSDSFDGIVYYSPSIFWGGIVKKIKKRCNCPSYLVLRDLFPQWVIDAGIIKQGSLIEKYFRFFERQSYKQANKIGLMSENNLELFCSINKNYSCEVLHNWASVNHVSSRDDDYVSIRNKLNIQDKIIFFYGGNIGHAQDMANLMRLVKRMQVYENAHFLFIGQGDEVTLINQLAKKWNLSNYSYLPSVDQNEFKRILSEIDVGLFSLSVHHSAHNFPGKLLGYMVESLPILGSVNAGNDLLNIINNHNAGLIHINGEDELLFSSASKLYRDNSLRSELGCNAKKLLIEQFSVNSAAQQIERGLGN